MSARSPEWFERPPTTVNFKGPTPVQLSKPLAPTGGDGMTRVLAFLPDARANKRLATALAGRERAWRPVQELATGWDDARTRALSGAPDLFVFDPYATGCFAGEPIERFAAQFPSCVLVGYGRFARGCARDVLALSRAGIHDIATLDLDDAPGDLAVLLERALLSGTLGKAVALLQQQTPPPLRTLLPGVLFRAHEPMNPLQVARMCHCHPKTLRAYLRGAGLPPLARLVIWVRLIRACQLLLDPGRSVESVALVLGFASANSFRNQLLRYLGVCPTEVRERHDPSFVLQRFTLALDRSRASQSGSPPCGLVPSACATAASADATVGV